MFSGLDTDALVKAMLSSQQAKIDKIKQNQQLATWKKETMTDFSAKIKAFENTYASLLGEKTLMSMNSYASFNVSMASNTALGVKTSSTSVEGSYSVSIQQVATASKYQGTKMTTLAEGYSTATLQQASVGGLTALPGGQFTPSDPDGNFSFEINDITFSFNYTESLSSIMDKVNRSAAGVTMSYSQITDTLSVTSKSFGSYQGLESEGIAPTPPELPNAASFVDGTNDQGYIDAMKEYNEDKIEYDAALKEFAEDNAEYLADQARTIRISDDSDDFFAALGINIEAGSIDGQEAKVTINGVPRTFSSNKQSIDGIELEFREVTSQSISFSVTRDAQASVERFRGFIDDFNALIKELFTLANEKKNYKYNPLTDAEKSDMNETQIAEWQNLAKAGLMYRDNALNRFLSDVREKLTATLGGAGTLASIGIKTTAYRTGESWGLEIDEEKFLAALELDPSNVYNIFAGSKKQGDGGLLTQFASLMDSYVGSTKTTDIANLNTSLDSYTKRISEQEDKMYLLSEKYYLQYAKLETSLAQMQSQTDTLTGLLGTNTSK
jgi:flagellar hook-associated protein 2